jgi:molecular chaperone HscA
VTRAREALEAVSEPFARRRMERALQAGMAGRSVEAIESALDRDDALDERRGGHNPSTIEP